jgi:hypothetical protein
MFHVEHECNVLGTSSTMPRGSVPRETNSSGYEMAALLVGTANPAPTLFHVEHRIQTAVQAGLRWGLRHWSERRCA